MWFRMRRRQGKCDGKGSRCSSSDHLITRCETASPRATVGPPKAHVETVRRSMVRLKVRLFIDQVGFLSRDICAAARWKYG
jgi:hypothetical protein